MSALNYDDIGYWSEVKLEIIRKYACAYSAIMNKQRFIKKHIYIDAFAGAGQHLSKQTGGFVAGSPLNALAVSPPFKEFHLIDLDGDKVDELRRRFGDRQDVVVYEEDANKCLLEQVFPRFRYEDYSRALCLLDPYKLNVDWQILRTAGQMRTIEIFSNFMIMDANMNVFRKNPEQVPTSQIQRMDKVWGDRSWRESAYRMISTLFGDIEEKVDNEAIAEAFRKRLETVAGFKYVPEPIPMRNSNGAVIYYLFFASPNEKGAKIVKEIFDKYRNMGIR